MTQISQKLRTQWTAFCFRNKTQLALSRQVTQIKKIKNGRPVLEKRLFSKTFFTSVLTIATEIPKTKGKNPDKLC